MNKAIIGKKLGMTQVFLPDGTMVPVTVIQAGPCTVTQKKTVERDGYNALQFGFESVSDKKLNKPQLGHLKKSGATLKYLHEFQLDNSDLDVGSVVTCDAFAAGELVDVTGITKGHGFCGVIESHTSGGAKASPFFCLRVLMKVKADSAAFEAWKITQRLPACAEF